MVWLGACLNCGEHKQYLTSREYNKFPYCSEKCFEEKTQIK